MPCDCTQQTGTFDDEVRRALKKFQSTSSFNNLTKLGDLGLTDKQLSVFLYYLEGKYKLNLGCPIPIEKCKKMTIIEIKTKVNENGYQNEESGFRRP